MSGSQKFISKNRAPRVQIEYDVELYGTEKKVQLPFVMGVMSDLSGKSEVPKGSVADRKFLEIDSDNFDQRMKAMKPRAAFDVPNTLTGEGNLSVDLVFEKMSDFSPAEIARKVEPLRKLLEARTQLENLMTYMDGKAGAEALIEKLVANPEHLRALALGAEAGPDTSATFDAIKAAAPQEADPEGENQNDILASMADAATEDAPEVADQSADILASLASSAPADETPDNSADILADMAAAAPESPQANTDTEDALAALAAQVPEAAPEVDTSADVLAGLAADQPDEVADDNSVEDALASVLQEAPEETESAEESADILASMAETGAEQDAAPEDGVDDLLASLAEESDAEEAIDDSENILADMAELAPALEAEEDSGVADLLADLAADAPQEAETPDISADILAELAEEAPLEEEAETGIDDLLADMATDLADAPLEDAPLEDDGLDDLLAELADTAPEAGGAEEEDEDILADIAAALPEDIPEPEDNTDDLLAALAGDASTPEDTTDESADILAGLADEAPDEMLDDDGLDDLLADLAGDIPEEDEADDGLDDLLAGMAEAAPEEADDDSESILAGLTADAAEDEDEDSGLDDMLARMAEAEPEDEEGDDDLDALLSALGEPGEGEAAESEIDGLADLLADDDGLESLLEDDEDDGLDALLSADDDDDVSEVLAEDEADDDDLAALLADVEEDVAAEKPKKPAFQPDFGSMSAAKLQDEAGARRKFRIAVLGDFSGRGNRGDLESGAALGKRKAFKLDWDTMEDVIARFRTTLTLPLGDDGAAVEVELNELDDLHPDELFENVEMFSELNMLRRDLKSGRNLEQTLARLQAWGGEFGDFKALSKKRSKGSAAPADMRLSDFQSLIGDTTPPAAASSTQELISRIIGPHIVAAKDEGTEEMIAAVDRALSTAMSSVLHHPDFQAVETAWRSIELLGRRVEASAELEVVVYDLSVEEFSADLAAQEDMAESGLFDMLVEKPRQDESAGPISAVVGLYTWEETPTHAELLARMARICAHMDAPFISAIGTGFMGIKPEDRHPLVKKTWGALAEMPEAKYLGLASPRFMLRMPYGKKTEPVDRFDYEEFNLKEGMRSMLMANPALLVAVLLAETKAQQGGDMSLGSIMSLNDMPFHYMTDQYGDQVALPCTERLLSVSGAADVIARGFMPVLSVQGQNMVKLGSFQAVGGGELLGIWAGDAAKDMKSGKLQARTGVGISSAAKATAKAAPTAVAKDEDSDDDFDLDLELGDDDDLDLDLDLGDDDDGLDDLLAGFGDDDDDDDDDDEMDADLAALLGDL